MKSAAKGMIKAGARKPRPGWRHSPVGTGGRMSRPDNGLPNLTSCPLSIVIICCSAFKASFDAGRCVFDAATEGVMGGRRAGIPPVFVATVRARDLLTCLSTALAMTEAAYLEARRRRDL
jgi:hypothetical protein